MGRYADGQFDRESDARDERRERSERGASRAAEVLNSWAFRMARANAARKEREAAASDRDEFGRVKAGESGAFTRRLADIGGGIKRAVAPLGDIPISPYQPGPRSGGEQRGAAETARNIGEGLRTEIPGSQAAARVAGDLGERAARGYLQTIQGPAGPLVNRAIEEVGGPNPEEVAGSVGEMTGETIIPTEIWMAALEFAPGIGTVPDLVRAFRARSPEAVAAVRRAMDSPAGQAAIRRVTQELAPAPGQLARGERGMVDIFGKKIEHPKLWSGGDAKVRAFRLADEAVLAKDIDKLTPEAAQTIMRRLNAETGGVLTQSPDVQDILARPQEYTYGEAIDALNSALDDAGFGTRRGQLITDALRDSGIDALEFPANKIANAVGKDGKALEGRNIVVYNGDALEGAGGFKFDPQRAGSGQGADLRGRGMYLTDNEEIARYYASNDFDPQGTVLGPHGRPIEKIDFDPTTPGIQTEAQARFNAQGETVAEPLMKGDRGQQGSLLGSPQQTGEGLSTESAGPLFQRMTDEEASRGAAAAPAVMKPTRENLDRWLEIDHPGAGEPGYQEALRQTRLFAESFGITTRGGRPGTETDKGLSQMLSELAKLDAPAADSLERTPKSITAEIDDLTRQRNATLNNDRSSQLDRHIDDLKLERARLETAARRGTPAPEALASGDTTSSIDRIAKAKEWLRRQWIEKGGDPRYPPNKVQNAEQYVNQKVDQVLNNPEIMREIMAPPARKPVTPQVPPAVVPETPTRPKQQRLLQRSESDVIPEPNSVPGEPENGVPVRHMTVPTSQLVYDPGMQARAVAQGAVFDPRTVKQIVENYDPYLMDELVAAPTPGRPGFFTVLGGMHRGPALEQLGLDAPLRVLDLDLADPAQYKIAQQIADATNATQRDVSLKGQINILKRAGTDDIGTLRAKYPRFNDQQIIDAQHIGLLPGHVIDTLDALPASSPQIGIAAEVGRGAKAYGLTPDQAEGLFNRFVAGAKKNLPTRSAVRESVDLFGPKIAGQQQGSMLMIGETNPIVDAMVEHARLTKEIEKAKAQLARDIAGAKRIGISANNPQIVKAESKLAGLQAERAHLDGVALADEPSALASSTADAGGSAAISSTVGPDLGDQVPPATVSARGSEAPSTSMARQSAPSGDLPGPATIENIPESIPPASEAPGLPATEPRAPQPERMPVSGEGGAPPATPPVAAAAPPPPPAPPPAAVSTPPAASGNKYLRALRPLLDVIGEVKTSGNVVKRALTKVSNPSVSFDDMGKVLTAYNRQRIAADGLAETGIAAALDSHARRFGLGDVVSVNRKGDVRGITPKTAGVSLDWHDVFSRPQDYVMSPAQRAYIDDYTQLADEVEALRVDAGLPPRAKEQPAGSRYVPRQVEEIRGIRIRGRSKAKLERAYTEEKGGAAAGRAAGVRYRNPRDTMSLHVSEAYREIANKQLADALEPMSITPKDLLDPAFRKAAEKVGAKIASAQNAVLALQRAKRGEQIPTSTIKQIEDMFPELEDRVQQATEITLDDMLEMSERAVERGKMRFKPTSPGTLRRLRKEVAELEDLARNNPKLQPALRKKRAQEGFAKYRFAQEQEIRETQGWDYGDHVEFEEAWLEMERSTRTLIRENTRPLGNAVEVTQRKLLDDMIKEIRGIPYYAKTETGNRVTRYRGGLMEDVRGELEAFRGRYRKAVETARNKEVAPGKFWGPDQPDEIPITTWRNRMFPRAWGDQLQEAIGTFERQGGQQNWLAGGMQAIGDHTRFLSAVGDFAAPFVHGLPLLGRSPARWAKATALHYQAFADPAVRARYIRDHLQDFQDMAANGIPIGDPEMFAAIKEGPGPNIGKGLRAIGLEEVGKQTLGRFGASYDVFLGVGRRELWDATRKAIPDMAERGRLVRNMTGGLDSRALGVGANQRGAESMWLAFSPRLLRSTLALVKMLGEPKTAAGREAWRSLAGLATATTSLYIASGIAMGKSEEEIRTGLNPLNGKKFLSHNVNGDWIGVGGQIRAITQLLTASAVDVQRVSEGKRPMLLSKDRFDNPLISFYNARGAPAFNITTTAIEGTTGVNADQYNEIDGYPDMFKHMGTSALPFVVQNFFEGQKPLTLAASLVGARTSPPSFTEKGEEQVEEFGDPREAMAAALETGDLERVNQIKVAWRNQLRPDLDALGIEAIPGKEGIAPRLEFVALNRALLDSFEERLHETFGPALDVRGATNLSEVRRAYIDGAASQYAAAHGISYGEAESELGRHFDQSEVVAGTLYQPRNKDGKLSVHKDGTPNYERRKDGFEDYFAANRLKIWRENPDLYWAAVAVEWEQKSAEEEEQIPRPQ